MKKAYSSKFANNAFFFIYLPFIAIFLPLGIGCLIGSIRAENKGEFVVACVALGFLLVLMIASFFGFNRGGCTVIYDSEKSILKRKGFFFGYEYELKIEDIKEIVIVFVALERTTNYIFVDAYNTRYESGYKKSFIRLKRMILTPSLLSSSGTSPY